MRTVQRKAAFIDQVMRGRLDVREIDDISDTALSNAEVKALATGDERIIEQAKLGAEIARLDRLQRSHNRNQIALAATPSTDRAGPARARSPASWTSWRPRSRSGPRPAVRP